MFCFRQLWWGHRIPVYYVGDADDVYIVARNEQEARKKATEMGFGNDVTLRQEEDVLDTWFSSGLWPFATLGWPRVDEDPNSDLARFYPATCLETGYDILFFWVARMAMMGLELTGKAPFSVIYLHGLVRAADGSKMSKTKGNVIDPLDTVAQYGADSLRYSLVTGCTPGLDIPLNMEKVESNRNFANKLWNICKFVCENALKGADMDEIEKLGIRGPLTNDEFERLALPEQYIVSKLHSLVESITQDIESYQLGVAGSKVSDVVTRGIIIFFAIFLTKYDVDQQVYEFLWDQYADWYIEISKTRLYEGAGGGDIEEAKAARRVLVYILDMSLRLLHPYMPFVTEQLWHHLPRSPKVDQSAHALMLADWPQMNDQVPLVTNNDAVESFECFQDLTRSIRNARAEYNVEPGKRISAIVIAGAKMKNQLAHEMKSLVSLAKLDPMKVSIFESNSDEAKAAASIESVRIVVRDGVEAYLPLSGLIDPEKERKRLEKQAEKLGKEIDKLTARLQSKGFTDKAPPALVDQAKAELAELESQVAKVKSSLLALG